jgi:hypothetical protein
MVSITLSVPPEVRKKMKQFPEVNWSALIRKLIEEKVAMLSLKEKLLSKLKEENESGFTDWTIELGRRVKEDSAKKLKKEGLL